MKVLIFGGAGYIGSHVVKYFIKNGDDIVVFDNLSTGQRVNIFNKTKFIEGDILDYSLIVKVMKEEKPDAVIHLAAKKAVGESMENPQIYSNNNITGSINILNAMIETGINNIVFSSSATVYGNPQYVPIDEEHPLNVMNYYGFTKYNIEKIMQWYDLTKGLKFMSLRYFNAVGYDDDIKGREKNSQNLLPVIVEVAEGKREKLKVFGTDYKTRDGTCIRDYIHVSDLARAHVLAAKNLFDNKESQILNLGTSKGTTVKEIISAVEKVIGRSINIEYTNRRLGDPATLIASSAKAKKILGWEPYYLDMEEIVKTEMVEKQ